MELPRGLSLARRPVPSVCVQCNVAVSIRIASPGNDGDVTQSNLVAASAASSSSSSGVASTQPVAQPALPPPPVPPSVPVVVPPPPVFSMPSIPLPPTVDVRRELAGVVPLTVVPTTCPL